MAPPLRVKVARRLCKRLPIFISQRLQSFIASYNYLQLLKQEYTASSITGSNLTINISDFHGGKFAILGFYDWRNLAIAKAICKPGDTIVEIGANVGTESVGFRDIVGPDGKLILFEPLPNNIRQLERMVILNKWKNVFIEKCAVGERRAEVDFVMPSDTSMSGIGYVDTQKNNVGKSEKIRVPIVPLDDSIAKLDKLKIIFTDTEGHEYNVLKGAKETISHFRPIIVLEASPKLLVRSGHSTDDLLSLMLENGYSCWELGKIKLTKPHSYKLGKACNWVCIPNEKAFLRKKIDRVVLLSGISPRFKNIHPLVL